jgi:steroid delta-isomerase
MISSPKSPHDALIRDTVASYQSTFSSGDRDGWLSLFADDGVVEDPVGSPPRCGRAELEAFWDGVHAMGTPGDVKMIEGPNVCGEEVAWAFELRIPAGENTIVVGIIDQGTFDADGRIKRIRAFWNEGTIRVEPAAVS